MRPIASSADAELGYVTEWQLPPSGTTASQPQSAACDEGSESQPAGPPVERTLVEPDGGPSRWPDGRSAE